MLLVCLNDGCCPGCHGTSGNVRGSGHRLVFVVLRVVVGVIWFLLRWPPWYALELSLFCMYFGYRAYLLSCRWGLIGWGTACSTREDLILDVIVDGRCSSVNQLLADTV